MSTIESVTLMLALVYSTSLLYWSGKKWGALVSGTLLIGATLASFFWPLLLILLVSVLVVTLVGQYLPAFANADGRPNAIREICQHFFALSILLVAVQYAINAGMLYAGETPWLMRPDVGDAFLPIAGGIELKAIITLGLWDQNHPAAVVMLCVVLLTGIVCKRAFCGWACPLGLAGEYLYKLRKKVVHSELLPPAWIDWPLRMLKYLLLAALCYLVISMPSATIPHYLAGNYHKVADLKMAAFFLMPSMAALICFGIIFALAAWRRQGFCRYICPYGALLGIVSFLSPFKIRRNTQHCLIDAKGMSCDKCTRACPANISVHTQKTVRSDECQACLRCVSACPKKQALQLSTRNGINLSARGLLIVLLTLMFMLPLLAYVSGYWHSQTPDGIKMELIQKLNRIGH